MCAYLLLFLHKTVSRMYPLFSNEVLPQGRYRVRLTEDSYKNLNIKTRGVKEYNDGLFADDIWPGAVVLSDFLCEHPYLCANRRVVELGAGGALPSLVALALGAIESLITDYPGSGILENIQELLRNNNLWNPGQVCVAGLKWGQNVDLQGVVTADGVCETRPINSYFDLIILAELLWRDTYPLHGALLDTVTRLMGPGCNTTVLCSFAHRPTEQHTPVHDLEFLRLAESKHDLLCEKVLSRWVPDASGGGGYDQYTNRGAVSELADDVREKLDAGLVEVHLYKITRKVAPG